MFYKLWKRKRKQVFKSWNQSTASKQGQDVTKKLFSGCNKKKANVELHILCSLINNLIIKLIINTGKKNVIRTSECGYVNNFFCRDVYKRQIEGISFALLHTFSPLQRRSVQCGKLKRTKYRNEWWEYKNLSADLQSNQG